MSGPDQGQKAAKPRVLVVANQKGGVGKTTTAINLGTALAAVGEPTLVLDLDPQGNASTGLGIARSERRLTTYDVLMGEARISEAVMPTRIPGLSIVPSTVDLSGAELELIAHDRRNHILKEALAEYSVYGSNPFSYVLIDCPPSLTLLTVNAMVAADAVIVPLQCEFFALEGLGKLLNTIKIVQSRLNTELQIEGILMTMYDGRLRLCNQVVNEVRRHFEDMVFYTIIHRNSKLSEAPSVGKPVVLYDSDCKGAINYLNLAKEVLQKNDLTKMTQEERILE